MQQGIEQHWCTLVARDPEAPAVIEGASGLVWSRARLLASAEAWLRSLPAGTQLAGRRVTFAEPNSAVWLTIFLGLQLAGAIAVPLDPTEPVVSRLDSARAIGAAWAWENGRLEAIAKRPRARLPDLCLVKLTSGSTGTPRALVFTQAQMIADGCQVCASMGITPSDLNLGVIPFGHSYGLGNLVMPLFIQGTPILAAGSPLPHVLAADCARWKPTVFPAVPTLLRALVVAEADPAAIASLRLVISAGAPLAPDIATAFAARFGRNIHSFYGTSETGGITFDRTGTASLTARSVGTSMEGVTLSLTRSGRVRVESAAVLAAGGFSPADRARFNEQGELVLLGRTGRTAKVAGRRVDLSEIEHTLRAVPGVRDAYATQHPTRADALAAAVATSVDASALRRELGRRTASWKIPERLLVLADLPRNARGKVDRRRIEALLASGS